GLDAGFLQFRLHADHGAADDVGGGALDGGVDGGALDKGALGRVARIGVGELDAAAENGGDVAIRLHPCPLGVHVTLDAGEALEIGFYVIAGDAALDAELVGEAEGGNAVDDAEIDGFRLAAHVAGHAFHRHVEHFARRHGVNVQ